MLMSRISETLMLAIFLDIDGVLSNSNPYSDGYEPMGWAHHLIDALEPYPQVALILSTNWVRNRGLTRTLEALPEGLRKRVVGTTYDPAYDDASRFEQIKRYVERAGLTRWVAIDDLFDGSECWDDNDQEQLILTDPNRGLSDPVALARLKIFLQRDA